MSEKAKKESRRTFLKGMGLSAGAAAVAGSGLAAGSEKAEAAEAPSKEPRYRKTAHVSRYYETTRL